MAGFSEDQIVALIPQLRRYARALTADRAAADDLAQDTVERAWNKRHLWRNEGSLRAWLFSVMHNVFINSLRRTHRTESFDAMSEAGHEFSAVGSDSAESAVVLRQMQSALMALPVEQREVVLLIGLEQLSYDETATALAIPIGTVMSRLSRGRERLRRLLDGEQSPVAILRRVK